MPVSTRSIPQWPILLCLLVLVLGGGPARAETSGNALFINLVEPGAGAAGFMFPVVEVTDDSGLDGEPDTGDDGENDGYPDPGEDLSPMSSETIKITLRNEARQGVVGQPNDGRPLFVDRIELTYYDANGDTPLYAPQVVFSTGLEIAPGGEGTVELVAVPYRMKVPANATVRGLRSIFLYPVDATEFALAQGLRVHIYAHAKDKENSQSSDDSASVNIGFFNPNVGGGVSE